MDFSLPKLWSAYSYKKRLLSCIIPLLLNILIINWRSELITKVCVCLEDWSNSLFWQSAGLALFQLTRRVSQKHACPTDNQNRLIDTYISRLICQPTTRLTGQGKARPGGASERTQTGYRLAGQTDRPVYRLQTSYGFLLLSPLLSP